MTSTTVTAARIALMVIYTDHLEESREFYGQLGMSFEREQHGRGPIHYAATFPDGTVLELYPATERRPVTSARLGFHVDGQGMTPPLEPGRHVVQDPDGRAVELYAA
ncbi:VOC family protein [Streptomyces sp. NPDC002067]